jgi:hypothetical protein
MVPLPLERIEPRRQEILPQVVGQGRQPSPPPQNWQLHLGLQPKGGHLTKHSVGDVGYCGVWQDWVKLLSQDSGAQPPTKAHVDPNVAFPFQDDLSIRTIRGANAKAATPSAAATPTATEVVEIQDNEDNVSVLTAKTTSKAQFKVAVGSRVASGSNPVSGLTAVSTQPGAASGGLDDPASNGLAGGAVGGRMGK